MIRLTGSNVSIVKEALPQDDPHRRCPDISLATRMLEGWTPRVGLEEGLIMTIDYFSVKLNLRSSQLSAHSVS